ncbi:hypothetical protein GCM10007385_12820 [Tateyamaria omphalii]|nr:hypothetical protein GCM10007385_12820 [Tateyamaria omphalii]
MSKEFAAVLSAIPRFQSNPERGRKSILRQRLRRIGILADLSLPQCKRYRVDQKVEYLTSLGLDTCVFDVHSEVDKAAAECAFFDLWICYRTPAYYGVLKLLSQARALDIPTVFEIDDLILDPTLFPETRDSYGNAIDEDQYAELRVLPFLYAAVARCCRFGIASTDALSEHLAKLVQSGQSFVLPNGIDAGHLSAMQSLVPDRTADAPDVIRVFVGSATKSHKDHVAEVFVPQAVKIAQAFPGKVQFSLCGSFDDLYRNLDDTARRAIGHIELGWDYASYLSTLSGFDINVVPLEKSTFTDCKSEIKWLEASLLGVPSVLAATDAYTRCVDDGATGLLVKNEDYVTPISRLCQVATDRARIGNEARSAVTHLFSADRQCAALKTILDQIGVVQ